jgi:serine/threonine protein phosphatase 1
MDWTWYGKRKKQKKIMRRFVVGDIHGMSDLLNEVLNKVEFDFENDLLISIGDIADRGPDVYGCVETLLKVKNLIFCLGNHDEWFIRWMLNGTHPVRWMQGGNETAKSYLDKTSNGDVFPSMGGYIVNMTYLDIPKEHRDFWHSYVPYHVTEDNMCFVHGGYDRDVLIKNQTLSNIIWDRELLKEAMSYQASYKEGLTGKFKDVNEFDKVFIGHTPTIYWNQDDFYHNGNYEKITDPLFVANVIDVDTGAVYDGALTLMNIDTLEYCQAKSKK